MRFERLKRALSGQILICVGGKGWYQEWGKDPVAMKPGDCINIPVGVKHWHGAAEDRWFSHLAIEVPGEETSTEWLESNNTEQTAVFNNDMGVIPGNWYHSFFSVPKECAAISEENKL